MAGSCRKVGAAKSPDRASVIRVPDKQEIEKWMSASVQAATLEADKVPENWYTMKYLAANIFHKSLSQTSVLVTAMAAQGTVQRKNFRCVVNGKLKVIPHYFLAAALGNKQ